MAEAEGRPVGWAALIPRGEVGWLEDLWVEPAWIGRGLGRILFERVAAEARERGARRLEWEAEPNAAGFYEHLGGAYVRDSDETEWGRVLEVLGLDLASACARDPRGTRLGQCPEPPRSTAARFAKPT